jgi:hypothetical protein
MESATENFCSFFEASKPSVRPNGYQRGKTFLQTLINTKFASDAGEVFTLLSLVVL